MAVTSIYAKNDFYLEADSFDDNGAGIWFGGYSQQPVYYASAGQQIGAMYTFSFRDGDTGVLTTLGCQYFAEFDLTGITGTVTSARFRVATNQGTPSYKLISNTTMSGWSSWKTPSQIASATVYATPTSVPYNTGTYYNATSAFTSALQSKLGTSISVCGVGLMWFNATYTEDGTIPTLYSSTGASNVRLLLEITTSDGSPTTSGIGWGFIV